VKSIRFLGAAGEVTGSSYLVTADNGSKILVDLGMFQGPKEISELNYQPLEFNSAELKGVFVTHAHLDHVGRLPLLMFGGYFGKIYMTAPTRALTELTLTDAAKIAKDNREHDPLYSADEVAKTLNIINEVEYHKEFQVDCFKITFIDAGHILGSASIQIVDTSSEAQQKMVFSGDLGNFPEDIVRPTEFFDTADFVVMESTYGDKPHPQEDATEVLMEEINAIEKSGGVLLIPAFSLERTQELLHRMNHLKKDGKIKGDTPVFLDSPMGIHATIIFRDFKEYYNQELQSHIDDPFSFENLIVTENPRDSREIVRAMNPKIIIAGSGMMSGGRIMHHAINYLPDPKTRVLFVGYQAEETIGRRILEGARVVYLEWKSIRVKAHVREVESLSSHADQPKLLTWLGHIKDIKKLFLIHGDKNQRQLFAEKVQQVLNLENIELPLNGQTYQL
jgi:metallo-beta-lactamase family protein